MRAWLAILVVVCGCHRPARKRWSDQLASVGSRLVAVVKSGAVKVDANAAIKAAAQTPPPPAAQRVREDEPPPQQHQTPPPAQHTPPPAQQTAPPDIKVTRVDASRPTIFVLRGQTHGGKSFCEQHATQEACTSACTAMLRQNMFSKPTPTSPKGCSCNEEDRGC